MFDNINKEKKIEKSLCASLLIESNSRGFAGIMALLAVCGLVLILTFSLGASILAKKQISKNLLNSMRSYYLAESSVEDAVLRVIKNYSYIASDTFTLDGASVDRIINTAGNVTTINTSSSYSNNFRKMASSLTITADDVSFYYGVQVGEGGVSMANNSTIIGNLYSDGTINGGGSSSKITGDVIVATGMTLDPKGDWETYNDDRDFGKASPEVDIAMSFVPTSSGNLSQAGFYLKKTGSPSDGTIRIVTDNAGSPSKTQLAMTTLEVSKIGASYGWANYSFTAPANLTAGNTYWIIIDVGEFSSKYFYIGRAPGNADSVSKYSPNWNASSPVWTLEAAGDYEFKAWIGGAVTSLNKVTIKGNASANSIIDSNICGDAYYQNIDAASLSFLNSPTSPTCSSPLTNGTAYPNSPDSPVEAMPISAGNIADWKAAAEAGGVYSDAAHCSPASNITIGPAKLDCNFSMSNNKKLTLSGTVWVAGNITLSNNAIVELASGYGGNSGVMIADKPGSETTSGVITTSNNVIICGSSGYNSGSGTCNASNGSYVLLLSTHSGATNAIDVSNNADGAIFYAANGTANVANNANIKEITAYKLVLANNATVTYETGLASASFSSGPGEGWRIDSWNETQ